MPARAPRASRAAGAARVDAGAPTARRPRPGPVSERRTWSPLGAGTTLVTTWVRTPRAYGGYRWPHDRREAAPAAGARRRVPGLLPLARLVVATIRICLRYRVTGLASEAGFFALLSLPPLDPRALRRPRLRREELGPERGRRRCVDGDQRLRVAVPHRGRSSSATLLPTVDDVFTAGRFDLISVGFLLSLWSGSRALNVFVDTISIMYGQSGVRGIVQTRALSFSLYLLALVLGIVTIPLVLLGPTLLGEILPERWDALTRLYWPLVTLLTVGGLTSLYHVSTPRRSPWLRDVPGAVRHARPLAARVLRRARHDRGLPRRHVDLRSAVRADRAAHLALHARHRRAHRGGRQRRHPRALARARSSAPAERFAPGSVGCGRRRVEAGGPRRAGTTRSTATAPASRS